MMLLKEKPLLRVITLAVLLALAACDSGTPPVLPTQAVLPTSAALPPDGQPTQTAAVAAPTQSIDLSSVAVNERVDFVGMLRIEATNGTASVQADDGTTVQLMVPPPVAQALVNQRVQVIGVVIALEPLTVEVESINAASSATLFIELTSEFTPPPLPPELATQSASASFNIAPNLSALASYDAILSAGALDLAGYGLVSISNEVGVWSVALYNVDANNLLSLMVAPDGSVQSRVESGPSVEAPVSVITIERASVTVDSDAFISLLAERQLNTPPYTMILSQTGDAPTWIAITPQGQVLLTVNAATGEVLQ
jgi:hypothetical protein